jgi:hypothetical protein
VAAALEAVAERLGLDLPDEGYLAELRTLGRTIAAFAATSKGRALLRAQQSAEESDRRWPRWPRAGSLSTPRRCTGDDPARTSAPASMARRRPARGGARCFVGRDPPPPDAGAAARVAEWLEAVVTTLARGLLPNR